VLNEVPEIKIHIEHHGDADDVIEDDVRMTSQPEEMQQLKV